MFFRDARQLAAQKNLGVHVAHDGTPSVFTGLTPDEMRAILARAKKK